MGRFGIDEDVRDNVVTFKVTRHELLLLNMMSDLFESRSRMIRKILFDFAFQLDPEKVKEQWSQVTFDGLKKKVRE